METDDIIDILHRRRIPDAAQGFKLVFSPLPFPGYSARFVWDRPEHGGNWYRWAGTRDRRGWLCPRAVQIYFEDAPEEIYVKVSAK